MSIKRPYNDRGAVFEVTGPYRAHAASQLPYCHLLLFKGQVCEIGSDLRRFREVRITERGVTSEQNQQTY